MNSGPWSTLMRFGRPYWAAIRWRANEQDRADVRSQREAWFDGQLDLDPARQVFIDERWTASNMMRSHGRCRRGERLSCDLGKSPCAYSSSDLCSGDGFCVTISSFPRGRILRIFSLSVASPWQEHGEQRSAPFTRADLRERQLWRALP